MKPVYVNGPLLGERFDTDDTFVQVGVAGEGLTEPATLTYQFRQVAFHMGGKVVSLWVGWCGPQYEPDAEMICRALFRDDVAERMHVAVLPADPAGQAWRCGSCTFEQYGTGPGGEHPPSGPCPQCGGLTWEPQLRSEEVHGDHHRPGT